MQSISRASSAACSESTVEFPDRPCAPTVVQLSCSIQPYTYDPELAKKLLAGQARIELNTYTSDGRYVYDREIYQAINAQLGAVGFSIHPQLMEWGRLVGMMMNRSAGPFILSGGVRRGRREQDELLPEVELGDAVTADPDYDKLVDQAGAEMDEKKRTDDWKEAQKPVHERFYVAAVWQAASIYGFSKNFAWDAQFGENLDLAAIKIAK